MRERGSSSITTATSTADSNPFIAATKSPTTTPLLRQRFCGSDAIEDAGVTKDADRPMMLESNCSTDDGAVGNSLSLSLLFSSLLFPRYIVSLATPSPSLVQRLRFLVSYTFSPSSITTPHST
ncbi:hypothetical protein HYC85_018704 [Camellia sinensis]|uniref:Uncharacterized protein n=1 Tax=Camellia sinensis TaxID=4442 RepID=A0A7J7GVZ7_CAMSI|nr:hypothetical protein HYC85_018704 [Camellia sinensis]